MIGAILGCRPTETGGDLALPNSRKFLHMLVIERSLHCATCAICEVVSLFLLHMNNHLTLPGIDVSGHFARGLGDAVARLGGRGVNERPHGEWGGYFWTCSGT
jgi:hypothetical protein